MNRIPVTAVFDIGKTNKKFFLFDENLEEVFKTYIRLEASIDEDGFPSEPLQPVEDWIIDTFKTALNSEEFEIKSINFSAHGASFVHIGDSGIPVTPLYDYLKPFPPELLERFYAENGGELTFCQKTSSPPLAMLNSGLQIYFIKYIKPQFFQNIKYCLHLPQYFSFLFSGKLVSDFTSIGCHTGLWDFEANEYHPWVKHEGLESFFPPIVAGNTLYKTKPELGNIPCGIGIHDSSAALLPYLKQEKEPFALLSTGTWAISINPFNKTTLSADELAKDCLQFLSITGDPIKISRLFIGEEHHYQLQELISHFGSHANTYKDLKFDENIYLKIKKNPAKKIKFHYLKPADYGLDFANEPTDWSSFVDFEEAYFTFLDELTDIQIESLKLVLDSTPIKRLFVDGGFNANEVFLMMLRKKLPNFKLIPSDFPNGSALGAAMLVTPEKKH
jgi:sugar (pentulose or hexulose) kinase